MPYQWESYPVTGQALRTAADNTEGRLSKVRSVVSQTEQGHQTALNAVDDQLDASMDDAPRGVITQANDTERKAIFAAGCLKYFAHAVDIFNTTGISPRSVSTLNTDFADLVRNKYDGDLQKAREAEEGVYDTEYGRLEANLDEAARHTSTMLNQGPTDENVKDLYSWGALPITAALIFPSVDFSHQYLPPEQAQALARYLADQVKNGDVDVNDVRLMTTYKGNADFAAEFYRNVTPDQMTDAITSLSDDAFPPGSPTSPEMYEDQRKLYADFLVAAGTMLATYSRATGDNTPPSNFADTWGNEIVSDEPGDEYNATALSMLFKHGQDAEFDGNFLADVTEIVYQYEQDRQDEGPIWGP